MDTPARTAPPQLSPDGHWWWDGAQWVPAAQAMPPLAPIPQAATAAAPVATAAAAAPAAAAPVAATATAAAPSVPHQTTAPAWAATPPGASGWSGGASPWQGSPAGWQPSPPQRHDGLAVASLVLSLVWMAGLASYAAVACGHLSRRRAKKEGRTPSGLTVAGLVLGYIGSFFSIGVIAAIAIPTFLDQRGKALDATVKSDLRAAALVQEEMRFQYDAYVDTATLLSSWTASDGVDLQVLAHSPSSYCLVAQKDGAVWYLGSDSFGTSTTPCA